jgi:hypothetical protein
MECEVISVPTATGNLALHGITFEYSRGGRGGQHLCAQRHDARLDRLVNAPAVQQGSKPWQKKRMSGEQACTGQNSRSVTPLRSIQFMCVPYRQLLR